MEFLEHIVDVGKLNVFCALAVFSLLVLMLIRRAQTGVSMYIRPLAGLKAIEEAVGRATEMGSAVLYVPGIDDVNNITNQTSFVAFFINLKFEVNKLKMIRLVSRFLLKYKDIILCVK